MSVTFRQIVNDAGQIILGTRSGGGTFIAVETFGDGHREAFDIGCGVGIHPHECFSDGTGGIREPEPGRGGVRIAGPPGIASSDARRAEPRSRPDVGTGFLDRLD